MKLEPQDSTLSQAHNVQTKENSSPDLAQSSPNLPTSTFKISLNIILYYICSGLIFPECILMKPKVKCYTSACLIVTLLKSLTVTYSMWSYNLLKLSLDVFGSSEIQCSTHGKLLTLQTASFNSQIFIYVLLFIVYFCYAWQYWDCALKHSMRAHSHVSASVI